MATLRPAILKEITQTLNNTRSHLNAYDFNIQHADGSLTITYNFKENTYFNISFNNREDEYTETQETSQKFNFDTTKRIVTKKDFSINGKMAPGQLATEEEFHFYGIHGIKTQVEKWVISIWDDLTADPIVRVINKQKSDLDGFLNQFNFDTVENGDEYYSKEEIIDIKNKLKTLEDKIIADLEKTIQDKEQLKTELNELKKEFETFKQTASHLNKKNWIKATLSKLFIWGSKKKNQELLKAAAEYGKNMIEEFTKN